MNKHTLTQRKLYEMFTENTGRHFLDSGGAYGRHWERNQLRPIESFISEPNVHLSARYGYIEVTVSLFKFLEWALEYNTSINMHLKNFDTMYEDGDAAWHDVLAAWTDSLEVDVSNGGYTYNEENHLTQDFQYWTFEYMDEFFVIIQLHNGCDARGGFTAPRVFKVTGYEPDYALWQHRDVYAGCDGNHHWSTMYDGHSLHPDDEDESNNTNLSKCKTMHQDEWVESDEYIDHMKAIKNVTVIPAGQMTIDGDVLTEPYVINPPVEPRPEGIVLYDDENIYCPICGEPLWADAYWD